MSTICNCIFWCVKPLLLLVVVIFLLPLVPNLPPDFKFTSFTVSEPAVLQGKLALNTLLNGAERLYEGEIRGPEGFVILNGELYTSLHGGYVAKIVGNEIRPVVKFGLRCDDYIDEAKCGRPLGLFAKDNLLYVADAYYGLFTFDVTTGKKSQLVSPNVEISGRKPKLFNSVAVANDGTVYWTDSTSDVSLQDGLYSLLADGTGRLIKYDPQTKKNTVLIDGILFANGLGLTPDESFIVVSETGMSRLLRYWLKGPKAGESDIFADQLPGLPDNIQAGSNGFLVSLVLARDDQTPALLQSLYPFPWLRKAASRALALVETAAKKVGEIYPNNFSRRAVHFIGHFEMSKPLAPLRVTLVVYDLQANIVDSFHALDGSVTGISDAIAYQGALFLGSPFNQYLGRVKTPSVVKRFIDAFPTPPKVSVRIKEVPTSTPRPTSTTTKPSKPAKSKEQVPPATTPKPTSTTATTPSKPTVKPHSKEQIPTATTPRPTSTTTTPSKPAVKPHSTEQVPPTTSPRPTSTTTTPSKPAVKPHSTEQVPPTTSPRPTSTTTTSSKPHSNEKVSSSRPSTTEKPHKKPNLVDTKDEL